jgi:hypothetical protein
LTVPAYELFSSTKLLGEMAMVGCWAGLSTGRYQVGVEPVGAELTLPVPHCALGLLRPAGGLGDRHLTGEDAQHDPGLPRHRHGRWA